MRTCVECLIISVGLCAGLVDQVIVDKNMLDLFCANSRNSFELFLRVCHLIKNKLKFTHFTIASIRVALVRLRSRK